MQSAPDRFRPRAVPTRVWLVRHGLSTFNLHGLYQGSSDQPELTDRGRVAARLTAQALAGAGIRVLVSSPLRRALATAQEILDEFRREGLPVPELTIDDRLKEIDLPEWQGLPFAEVKNRFPEQHQIWMSEPHRLRMRPQFGGTAFPVLDLFEQARLFWKDLLCNQNANQVLVVAHGGSGRALISTAVAMRPARFHSLQLSHGGITAIDFPRSTAIPRIATLNSVRHLGEKLPKAKAGKKGLRLLLVPVDGGSAAAQQLTTRMQQLLGADRVVNPRPDSLQETVAGVGVTGLRTVLSIVPRQEFCAALARLLPFDGETAECFQPRPPGVTVIHYPGGGEPAVLQAVNLFYDAGHPAGEQFIKDWSFA